MSVDVQVAAKLLSFLQEAQPAKKQIDPSIEKMGTKIILPEGMPIASAIESLKRKMQDEETEVSIHEEVDAHPLEGAYALMNVMKEIFGWASPIPTPGFFGSNPPTLVSLPISEKETTQVVWGRFKIPNVEGYMETGMSMKDDRVIFKVGGCVKQKHKALVAEIATQVRNWIKHNSIYKGKAIRVATDDKGRLSMEKPPSFMDLSGVMDGELILSESVIEQVTTSIFTPIEFTAKLRQHKIPLKRGVLLEGPYGTGKTLTANVTALKCTQNGWTFIYLDRASGLDAAVRFARQYQPAVIFTEDIDSALNEDRTDDVNDILNNIDGIDSKNAEVMVILTTNHIERINRAMLRPGRLDAVITVSPPDASAVMKLFKLYARDLIPEGEDLSGPAQELSGEIPAVIREVVERSKMAAIRHSKDGNIQITGKDLMIAAVGMKNHTRLIREEQEVKVSYADKYVELIAERVAEKM